MKRIEIYGYASHRPTQAIETFCSKMKYPHALRDLTADPFIIAELRQRGDYTHSKPQIFIGDVYIGSFRDLLNTPPHIVQQMLGE